MLLNYLSLAYWRIVQIIIRLCVLPLVDIVCPIVDIKSKYFLICRANPKSKEEIDPELTIELWETYVRYLQATERIELDYFDILIKPSLAKINRKVKMKITSQTDTDLKYLYFSEFCEILEEELGSESVQFKYRYTKNSKYFESIFGDDGFYRRFKWCDWI